MNGGNESEHCLPKTEFVLKTLIPTSDLASEYAMNGKIAKCMQMAEI